MLYSYRIIELFCITLILSLLSTPSGSTNQKMFCLWWEKIDLMENLRNCPSPWQTRIQRAKKKRKKEEESERKRKRWIFLILQSQIFGPTRGSPRTVYRSLQYWWQQFAIDNSIPRYKHHWAEWLYFPALRILGSVVMEGCYGWKYAIMDLKKKNSHHGDQKT